MSWYCVFWHFYWESIWEPHKQIGNMYRPFQKFSLVGFMTLFLILWNEAKSRRKITSYTLTKSALKRLPYIQSRKTGWIRKMKKKIGKALKMKNHKYLFTGPFSNSQLIAVNLILMETFSIMQHTFILFITSYSWCWTFIDLQRSPPVIRSEAWHAHLETPSWIANLQLWM